VLFSWHLLTRIRLGSDGDVEVTEQRRDSRDDLDREGRYESSHTETLGRILTHTRCLIKLPTGIRQKTNAWSLLLLGAYKLT
jgi:hypothetical protein